MDLIKYCWTPFPFHVCQRIFLVKTCQTQIIYDSERKSLHDPEGLEFRFARFLRKKVAKCVYLLKQSRMIRLNRLSLYLILGLIRLYWRNHQPPLYVWSNPIPKWVVNTAFWMHNVCASPWWGSHTRLLCGLLFGHVKSACHQWLNVFFLHFYGAKMFLSSPPTIVPVLCVGGGSERQRLLCNCNQSADYWTAPQSCPPRCSEKTAGRISLHFGWIQFSGFLSSCPF